MSTDEFLINSIDNQFAANKQLNIFYENLDFRNHFLKETKEIIQRCRLDLIKIDEEKREEKWIELMTEKAIQTFCVNNQYMDISENHITELQALYKTLWNEIIDELKSENIDFDIIQKSHLTRLSDWLMQTNAFVKEINNPQSAQTIDVACSEYSAEFQLKILNIDASALLEPVLDIGCGPNANLVNYLRDHSIDAFGMDRVININSADVFKADWLDFDFKPRHWGTIISNQSFALHFTHHHNRKDGNYIFYARKYMEILNALKPGGTFYYAPGLPFIEAHLPKDKFKTVTNRINEDFSYTRVTCLG